MNIKKSFFSILTISMLTLISFQGCDKQDQDFDPPNKTNITNGTAEKLSSVGTAMKILKKGEKMAKIWDKEALIVNINGTDLDQYGSNKTGVNGSKWILTFFSAKKISGENAYTIVFSGNGAVNWVQSDGRYTVKNSIENFSADSDKAFKSAETAGLPKGIFYSADLSRNDKGMLWSIGTKVSEKAEKYEVKKIDPISGEVAK